MIILKQIFFIITIKIKIKLLIKIIHAFIKSSQEKRKEKLDKRHNNWETLAYLKVALWKNIGEKEEIIVICFQPLHQRQSCLLVWGFGPNEAENRFDRFFHWMVLCEICVNFLTVIISEIVWISDTAHSFVPK